MKRLARLRSERDNTKVETALAAIQKTASDRGHIFEKILDAVRVEATLGEICNRLRLNLENTKKA